MNIELQDQFKTIEIQKQELEKTVASKDKLYSIIGHDLFNAHSNIASFINILRRTIDNIEPQFIKKLTNELEVINNTSLNLLQTLIEWGAIQSKRRSYSPSSFNLKAMIFNNISLFKTNIEDKSIQIENNISDDTKIYADKELLGSVVRNLLSNAIKFSENNGVIKFTDLQNDGNITISITDNGIGISEQNFEHLFKIEETITTSGTSGEKGHGLGLVICKEMIDLHRGKISIRSEANKGTTVTLTLPTKA